MVTGSVDTHGKAPKARPSLSTKSIERARVGGELQPPALVLGAYSGLRSNCCGCFAVASKP